MRLGSGNTPCPSYCLDGRIDEIGIFNIALSQ